MATHGESGDGGHAVETAEAPRLGYVASYRAWASDNPVGASVVGVAIALLILVGVLSIVGTNFLTVGNFQRVLVQSATGVVLAIGMTLVMTSGGIDLSIGSIVGLVAAVYGDLAINHEIPVVIAVLVALGLGALAGAFNGIVIVLLRVPPIITTLATLVIYRGLALVYLGGDVRHGFPDIITTLARGDVVGVPIPVILAGVTAIGGALLLNKTRFGRYLTAIGGNREASVRAGVPVRRYVAAAYVASGTLAALAAIMLTARLNAAQATFGMGLELEAIAAVVIGGTSLFGGAGTILGSVLGVLMVITMQNGLVLAGVSAFWQQVAIGAIVIAAVASRTLRRGSNETLM
jgi:ribose/xylose/arabinose/galactoside ABC-type transport system permease subunit